MIKFEKAYLRYDTGVSLRDLSFQIEQDEFVYLFGPSGSGKTSILSLIHLELFPNGGAVNLFEKSSSTMNRREIAQVRQKIGMVFQDSKLLADRDVYSNIALPLELAGYTKKEVQQKVTRKADELELRSRLSHFPDELSGGEKQRIALARASINTPELLLVDEPTAHLDDSASKAIMDVIWKIHEKGTTVLFATHKEALIKQDPARTISLAAGEIIEDRPR